MPTEETKKKLNTAPPTPELEIANEEPASEETGKGNWREAFRLAFDRARRQQKPAESRQELGRDKSKSLFLSWEFASHCCCSSLGSSPTRRKRLRFPERTRAAKPAWAEKLHQAGKQ
jgi:hypothetical protein